MSLYIEAATILTSTSGSLKSRIYHRSPSSEETPPFKSPPARLYALIVETLKHQDILNEVIANSGILGLERKLSHPLALLLLHDQLLTRGGIATSSGPLKNAVLKHKARLSAEFTRARIRRGHGTLSSLLAAANKAAASKIPRWVRINTLKTAGVEAAIAEGFEDYTAVATIKELFAEDGGKEKRVYYVDPIVPNLLAFPPGAELTTHQMYVDGKLILQDRSSCLPAHLLAATGTGARVVDATAAPGNKTTHIAALLGPGGRVVAFEKDTRRAEVLRKMVARAGGDGVIDIKAGADFLKADPASQELRAVTHLLLDPSCSGSGIVGREEYTLAPLAAAAPEVKGGKKRKRGAEKEKAKEKPVPIVVAAADEAEEQEETKEELEKSRLLALADFQESMVLHAMTFPAARKITYSTCSIHAEENEDVVVAVLAHDTARSRGWRVERREEGTLKEWERRGWPNRCNGDEIVAQACVRCNPVEDGGIGFFVVAFVRDSAEEPEETPAVPVADNEEEEWGGLSDCEPADVVPQTATEAVSAVKKKKNKKRQKNK